MILFLLLFFEFEVIMESNNLSIIQNLNASNSSFNSNLINDVNCENFQDPNWSNHGFQKMEEIRRLGKLCDITLIANDHKFSAHRIVLASSIPYFNAMFLHEMIESKQDTIIINAVDPIALEQLINYSYNGIITIKYHSLY